MNGIGYLISQRHVNPKLPKLVKLCCYTVIASVDWYSKVLREYSDGYSLFRHSFVFRSLEIAIMCNHFTPLNYDTA
jgi:hypothetical protein